MSTHTSMWPASSSPPIATRTQKLAVSEPNMTSRRGSRSATTPPTSKVETWASVHAANARPTYDAEPVRSRTAKATAIGDRFVPKNDTARATNSSRKLRSRRAPPQVRSITARRYDAAAGAPSSGGGALLVPVAPQPEVRLVQRHRPLVRLHVVGLGGLELTPRLPHEVVLR